MRKIEEICLKTFWTYWILYLATISVHVATSELSPDYSFKSEGQVILSSDLAHLVIEINFTQVSEGMNIAKKALEHLELVAAAVKNQAPEITLLLNIAKVEINDIESSFDDMMQFFSAKVQEPRVERSTTPASGTKIINNKILKRDVTNYDDLTNLNVSTVPINKRPKRQGAILLGGLLGVIGGATLFGYLQSDKISALEENIDDLAFRQDKIIHLMSAQNEDIAVNRKHISHLAKVMHEILRVLSTNHATIKIEAGTMYVHHLVSQLRHLMDKYLSIVQSASVHRLAAQAISATGAIKALDSITSMAAAKGLSPVISSITHFHQLPTSYLVTEYGLKLFTHCPLLKNSRILELHRFLGLPIHLSLSISGVIQTEKPLLALGRDENGNKIFQEFSEFDLTLCIKIGSIRVCPHSSQVLLKDPYPSCLFHLYYSMHHKALNSCRIFLVPPKDTAIAVSKNTFLTYSANPQTYSVSCRNQSRKDGLQILGTQSIHLDSECFADLPFFVLTPQTEFYFNQEVSTRQWTLPPSEFWNKDITAEQLESAYKAIKQETGLPSVTPLDIL